LTAPSAAPQKQRHPPSDHADPLQLAPERLRELATILRTTDQAPVASKRRHRRHDITPMQWILAAIVADPTKAPARFVVYPVDLSLTGVQFLHAFAVSAGTRVSVVFPGVGSGVLDAEGVVANCMPLDDGVYAVGVEFDESHSKRIMSYLVQSRTTPSGNPVTPPPAASGAAPAPTSPTAELQGVLRSLRDNSELAVRLQTRLLELLAARDLNAKLSPPRE
jgi:hypothetical protein